MISDRDIVVKCIAEGGDPSSAKVSKFAEGTPVTIGADDSVGNLVEAISAAPPADPDTAGHGSESTEVSPSRPLFAAARIPTCPPRLDVRT